MTIFFGLVLLVLAAAVVVLFAMLGELTARLPRLGVGYRDPALRPLPEARIGARPDAWPAPLAPLANGDGAPACVIVLSTACGTCEDVGLQLSEGLANGGFTNTAVVVSSGERGRGEEFIRRYGLTRLPYHVDEGGEWVVNSFGVNTSPTGLIIREGALDSAWIFGDVKALQYQIGSR